MKPDNPLILVRGTVAALHSTRGMGGQTYDDAANRATSSDGTIAPSNVPDEDGNLPALLEYFGCTVDGQRIIGVLPKVAFRHGDQVVVVVDPGPSPKQAYAIVREADQRLWVQPSVASTKYGTILLLAPVIGYAVLLLSVCALLCAVFFPMFDDVFTTFMVLGGMAVGVGVLLMLILIVGSSSTRMADHVMAALGFRFPRTVALARFPAQHGDRIGYDLAAAMRAHRSQPSWLRRSRP